jgi:hypothetical protein
MAATRIWLDVPYAQKDQAKALGARWDPEVKRWYAPRPNMTSLQPWTALPDVPDLLPGEDRSFGSGLFVDLVPSSCWFTNVRSCVDQKDWERLRRMIIRRARHRCEVCGASEDRQTSRWLEAHERWAYDEATHVQSLRRLVCLCTNCHTATHFGLAQIKGNEAAALAHLRTVAGMSAREVQNHIDAAFAMWRKRSSVNWTLDLRILTDAGITLAPPPKAADRTQIAGEQLYATRASTNPPSRQAPEPRPTPSSPTVVPIATNTAPWWSRMARWLRLASRRR